MTLDERIGAWIRRRRNELGLSQSALADMVGVRFQQIQKYENGTNRVSASRLWNISRACGVPVTYFFREIGAPSPAAPSQEERDELLSVFALLSAPMRQEALRVLGELARKAD